MVILVLKNPSKNKPQFKIEENQNIRLSSNIAILIIRVPKKGIQKPCRSQCNAMGNATCACFQFVSMIGRKQYNREKNSLEG